MAVDEVSCRVIATGQEIRNLGRWLWMMLQGKKNARTRIITTYCPTVSAGAGGAYSKQLETPAIMKIKLIQETNFG